MAYIQVYGGATADGNVYSGQYDDCVTEYENGSTTVQQLVDATYKAIRDNGGTPLTLRIWRDSSRDTWKTEATAHFGGTSSAQLTPSFPGIWTIIAYAVVIACVIGFLWLAFHYMTGDVRNMLSFLEPVFDKAGNLIYPTPLMTTILPLVVLGGLGLVGYFVVKKFLPGPKESEAI